MASRRLFITQLSAGGFGLFAWSRMGGSHTLLAQIPGGTLHPGAVTKYLAPLLIPPAMPRAGKVIRQGAKNIDYYEIAVRQFAQQILPAGFPATTVWGYGPAAAQNGPAIFNAPSLTIEAKYQRPVRVKWINQLMDANGRYLPHLLPVDQTLHWANPPGGMAARDRRPACDSTPGMYGGPVPLVTHVHGAVGVGDESDGYAEAWYLPDATNIPEDYAREGTWYDFFARKALGKFGETWGPGYATCQYPNGGRAAADWYHDHTLGMTRLNVYAGPAGFFIIRGGPGDTVIDARSGRPAVLPGPAPALGDTPGTRYYEIPIAVQDRSFNTDGSLFYPDTRAFFDGVVGDYIPDGEFSPIWQPEFFGNTIMVNGNTWPLQAVEQRRYRLRLLNGCQSRFLILDFNRIPGVEVWQIGNEGGFLSAPVNLTEHHGNRLLLGLAERADVIVDFTQVPAGDHILANVGPDEPFGGGAPGDDFEAADPASTGQVLAFRVGPSRGSDPSTPPRFLVLPALEALPTPAVTRKLALIEKMAVGRDAANGDVEGPVEALLGNVDPNGLAQAAGWGDGITENPALGATELWEMYNTTGDAHPMHVHEVKFEVVGRQALDMDPESDGPIVPLTPVGPVLPPEPWETGYKDTVIAYPGQVTRIKATFEQAGQYTWHCHIVEHEDNEMMRPYRIGPMQPGQPGEDEHGH
jgi:spore coat protein A, manganese oxidase